MTSCDILLKSFNENLKKLTEITKNNHFSIFIFFNFFFFLLCFHENHRILNCYHRRYEFCMQKYPNKHIFVEFADKA